MSDNKKNPKTSSKPNDLDNNLIGPKLNFEGREAYNLLRTNLMFSVKRNDRTARVIGVTSSVHGEGKSLTTINLAYSLAESGQKVVLVECDLRLPTLRKKIGLPKTTGLSNLLAGINNENATLHKDVLVKRLDVVQAGDIPPNPSELLGSKQFAQLVDSLADSYDIVILDLPPVGEVSDALVASKVTDGIIVVVRHDYTSSSDLDYTLRQLQLVNAKVIGFVYNGTDAKARRYKYGYKHGYGSSYASASKK